MKLLVKIESGKPFSIFTLTEGPDSDVTDHLESVKVVGLFDKDGVLFSGTKINEMPQPEGRAPKIVIDVEIKDGVGVTLDIDTQTGRSFFMSRGCVANAGWVAELEVVRGNYNRRSTPILPMNSQGELIQTPACVEEVMQLTRGNEPTLTHYKDGFVEFPAEWNGIPPVELPQWAVKRGEEFLREYVKRVHNPSTEKTEWILSVDSAFVNDFLGMKHGVTTGISLQDFVLLGAGHFSFRQRAQLENDPTQRHLINYDIIIQYGADDLADTLEIVLYERTKLSGEQRLANGRSIGIGGHIEKADALSIDFDDNRPDILETIQAGVFRERMEELTLISRDGYSVPEHVKRTILTNPDATRFTGFLCDNEDPKKTGTYHIGIVSFVLLPRGIRAETTGGSDKFIGAYPIAKILEEPTLERWSRIIGETMVNDQFIDLVGVKQLELRPAGVAPDA